MLDETETLADRLNLEPVIFRGSSSSELSMILIIATVFWLPVSIVIAYLFGAVAMGLGIAALAVLATVVIGSTVFQRIKRDRPDFYYQHLLMIQAQRLGLLKKGFIRHSGVWDLGRTL
jgi:conjugative transfer region protein (TIGR03750 family)